MSRHYKRQNNCFADRCHSKSAHIYKVSNAARDYITIIDTLKFSDATFLLPYTHLTSRVPMSANFVTNLVPFLCKSSIFSTVYTSSTSPAHLDNYIQAMRPQIALSVSESKNTSFLHLKLRRKRRRMQKWQYTLKKKLFTTSTLLLIRFYNFTRRKFPFFPLFHSIYSPVVYRDKLFQDMHKYSYILFSKGRKIQTKYSKSKEGKLTLQSRIFIYKTEFQAHFARKLQHNPSNNNYPF